ncbi:hypothetical protein [Halorubrum cibi]|uniref:hypothetical protein n=1 Tax=Halorubrum cibi TaxID=413815 RepID=UPI00115E9207|nr:hypothetical protein [Halorubrum cibi]
MRALPEADTKLARFAESVAEPVDESVPLAGSENDRIHVGTTGQDPPEPIGDDFDDTIRDGGGPFRRVSAVTLETPRRPLGFPYGEWIPFLSRRTVILASDYMNRRHKNYIVSSTIDRYDRRRTGRSVRTR